MFAKIFTFLCNMQLYMHVIANIVIKRNQFIRNNKKKVLLIFLVWSEHWGLANALPMSSKRTVELSTVWMLVAKVVSLSEPTAASLTPSALPLDLQENNVAWTLMKIKRRAEIFKIKMFNLNL